MRRVGVMGGTFDPIHHGHLVAASEVQAWFDLDEVVFVPTGDPWQKSDREVTEAELIKWCKEKAAGYKAPTSVEFRDQLARTATGKLQKFKLRAPYWEGRERQVN